MATGFVIRKNQYYDSVFLMGVNKRLTDFSGVQQAVVLMGTEKNKRLLAEMGVHDPQIDSAQANDLIVAVVAETKQVVEDALGHVDDYLADSLDYTAETHLRTFDEAFYQRPDANLAVISIPGEFAGREARKALENGLNVFIFSSNVDIEEEKSLKQLASQKGLLVMGPDCGTSLIGGVGIGFANKVRRGLIGVIGAAGTGLQEFTSQVHNAGLGISHAIGTGSHDPSDEIGAMTTLAALEVLEEDPQTAVIAFVSKPFGTETLKRLFERVETCRKPVIGCFLGLKGRPAHAPEQMQFARTIDEAVMLAISMVHKRPREDVFAFTEEEKKRIEQERGGWSPKQKYLRGLFAGGTFCYQAQQILRDAGFVVFSNTPLEKKNALANPDYSVEHSLIDMGDDYYTLGKPHPMIDGTLRRQRILRESQDEQVAILLLDFILGYNASNDPVGELIDAIIEARKSFNNRFKGSLTVVASICGTEDDPQGLKLQRKLLEDAGVVVSESSARAAAFCVRLLNPI